MRWKECREKSGGEKKQKWESEIGVKVRENEARKIWSSESRRGREIDREGKEVLLLSEKRRRNLGLQMPTPFQKSGTQIAGILCVEITTTLIFELVFEFIIPRSVVDQRPELF